MSRASEWGPENPNWRGGKTFHPLYQIYNDMLGRCQRPTHPRYASYGGRGITVCDRWRRDFWAFVADVGDRPPGRSACGRALYTLDRVDNDGPYSPDNVRWATASQQARNKRGYGLERRLRDVTTGQWLPRSCVMSKWDEMPSLALDFESTGVNPLEDRIVTAALVEMSGRGRPTVTKYVVDPGIDIPEGAAAIHGYTRDRAIAEQTHTVDQALFEIAGRVALWLGHGKPLVIMNAAYDATMLEAECARHGVDGLVSRLGMVSKVSPIIDVLVLDKYADPFRKGGRKLEQLCATYNVIHTGAHDAGGDALAAARLWPRVIAKHPRKFQGQTLGGLHTSQITWRRDQANSLRAYFDRIGTEHDGIDVGWPFHTSLYATAGAR